MRLSARIVLFIVLVCILPLLLLAAAASQAAHEWALRTTVDVQYRTADSLASVIARQLNDLERGLRLQFGNFRLDTAPDEARTAFLVATYRLFPEVSAVLLLDAEGQDAAPPVFQRRGDPDWVPGHVAITTERVNRLRQELPPAGAAGTATWGRPYRPPDASGPVFPLTFASPWGDGMALGVELGFGQVEARMALVAGEEGEVAMLAREGASLHRVGREGLVEPERFRSLLSAGAADVSYQNLEGEAVLASLAAVPGFDLVVVVAEPERIVGAAGREIQLRTWYIGGVSVLIAAVVGWLLAGSITDPVKRLRDAAVGLGAGDLARRVPAGGTDELADLGRAFNTMAASLEHSAGEIAAKNSEIETFNLELVERVEQRTAQLREAQTRLVQSGQLAAVAEMSAGLAHELNNPLAGILGTLQILRARSERPRDVEMLDAAEREAVRCKEIVAHLLRFTRDDGPGGETRDSDVVDLDSVVADVLALMGGPLRGRGLVVAHERAPLGVRGDAGRLGRALGQLLTSIRSVARPDAHLKVRAVPGAGKHVMELSLSALVSDQDDWRAASFGFWVARRVLEEHGITLEEPVTGGIWRLVAPSAPLGKGV